MKKKGEIKRQRIIVWYLIAIVLPCLILGILAFRGIKNDQALVERELQGNLSESGDQIISEADSYIKLLETSFTELVDSVTTPRNIIFQNPDLNRFCIRNNAVAGIFYIAGTGEFFLLNNGLLYLPDDNSTSSNVKKFQTPTSVLEKGWQYEFRENDYRKALSYFQDIFSNTDNELLSGDILNIIARLQKKLNLNNEAVSTYDEIWKKYPDLLIQNRLPSGAVALIEKSLLHRVLKDTISSLKDIRLLMSQMKDCRWELDQSHYDYFISKAGEILSQCKNSGNGEKNKLLDQIGTLKDSITITEQHTDYLLSLFENVELISAETEDNNENFELRKKILVKGKPYFLSQVPLKNKDKWGLITDQDYILNNILKEIIAGQLNRSETPWEIKDLNGALLLNSGNMPQNTSPVNIVFPAILPSWTITFYPEFSGLFASFFQSGGGVFLYIFIAILTILAFGLFFTLYTVNNEIHLSKLKSNFMSTVSHEFKSPLTSIRQMAEMLAHGRVPTPERQQKYYNTILQQSERLSHLIDNILDFSRMEEGKKHFNFVRADIVPVVKDIVEYFRTQPAGQEFDISLSVAESIPEIIFDREAIGQVINNLIDNAIKYSGKSGKVDVSLLTKGNDVIISIRDYGIGITKSDQDKIFNRFYRAGDELTQSVKGSGIGLTIVKQLVEAHHGAIDVDSESGKGSRFAVRLPVV